MTTILLILAGALAQSNNTETAQPFVLEHPGFVFEWLPPSMQPPVEGTLDEESGAVASSPSSDGTEYRLHYWLEEIPTEGMEAWLLQRLQSELPPDVLEGLVTGDVIWTEGGMESGERGGRSIGLVVSVNFNILTETGNIRGRGRAVGVFRNGYSLLVFGIAPFESSEILGSSVDAIISHMHI